MSLTSSSDAHASAVPAPPTSRPIASSLIAAIGCLLLLLADQLTKQLAIAYLPDCEPQSFFNDLFRITYAENSGAFLSLGADWSPWPRFLLMVIGNGLMLLVIGWILWKQTGLNARWRTGWLLVFLGGLGNLIDRVLYDGRVIDFLNMGIGGLRTGIFNLADVYISAGLLILIGCSLFEPRETDTPHSDTPSDSSSKSQGLAMLLFASFLLGPQTITLADTVVYRAGSRGGHVALNGRILEFNQRQMQFRVDSPDTIHNLTNDQVISFSANLLEAHRQAEAALEKNDFASARERTQTALNQETRPWLRRELLALMTLIATNQGDWITAANQYFAMLESDSDTRNQDVIPVMWTDLELDNETLQFARRELASSDGVHQLVAASWLLGAPADATEATEVLKELLYSPNPLVRNLARCQLWRPDLKDGKLSDGDLERWERQAGELTEPLKAGPMFLLGAGYQQLIQPELAAARLLWLPIMDARRVDLARQATLTAADLLSSVGQIEAAARLTAEAEQRFGTQN